MVRTRIIPTVDNSKNNFLIFDPSLSAIHIRSGSILNRIPDLKNRDDGIPIPAVRETVSRKTLLTPAAQHYTGRERCCVKNEIVAGERTGWKGLTKRGDGMEPALREVRG
jgi:hypothetical protein